MRGAAVLPGLGLGCAAGGGWESVLSVGLLPMYSLGLKNQSDFSSEENWLNSHECTLYKSEPLSQGWYHLDFFSVIPCFCCFISTRWG